MATRNVNIDIGGGAIWFVLFLLVFAECGGFRSLAIDAREASDIMERSDGE